VLAASHREHPYRCRGIRVINGVNALLADTPHEFARAVISLFREQTIADRLATEGRRTVEEHYDWRKTYSAWNEVYQFS